MSYVNIIIFLNSLFKVLLSSSLYLSVLSAYELYTGNFYYAFLNGYDLVSAILLLVVLSIPVRKACIFNLIVILISGLLVYVYPELCLIFILVVSLIKRLDGNIRYSAVIEYCNYCKETVNTYNRAQNLSLILSRLVPVSFVFLSQVINIPFSLSGLVSSILACLIGYIGVVLSKRVGIKMHIETTNKRRYWVLNLSDSPKLLSHLWVVVFSLQSMFFFIVLDNNYQLSSYDINYVILSGAMGGVISNWFYKKLENYLCILLLVWMFTSLFFIVNDSFLALIISSFFAALSSQVLFVFCNNQYILSLVGDDISSDVASKQFYGAIIPVFIFYLISFLSYENIKIFYFLFLIFTSPFLYFLFKLNKVSYD